MSELTILLPGKPGQRPGALERRAGRRHAFAGGQLVRLTAKPAFRPYQALLQNVSSQGVGLLVGGTFEPGTELAVLPRARRPGIPGVLRAHVRHTTRQPNGTWLIGCSLTHSLSGEELLALLGGTAAAA